MHYLFYSNNDAVVRKYAFQFLNTIAQSNVKYNNIYNVVKEMLLSKLEQLHITKPRYYFDSYYHRIKLRIVQALAKLYCYPVTTWDDRILNGILVENNQTNILIILQCIVVSKLPHENIFDILEKVS